MRTDTTADDAILHRVCSIAELPRGRARSTSANGYHIAVFNHEDQVYAVDNRCPHMGYPLVKGTIEDGRLICHWHHWEFDLGSGACFAGGGDDLPTFKIHTQDGDIFVSIPATDKDARQRERQLEGLRVLNRGLRSGSTFVTAKAVAALCAAGAGIGEIVQEGLLHGSARSSEGWSGGLAILVITANMWDEIEPADGNLFLVHGLSRVAGQRSSRWPEFPYPGSEPLDLVTQKRWFRRFISQRNVTGAERILMTLHDRGSSSSVIADFIFTAATDFYYTGKGHALDFGNKTIEALAYVDAEHVGTVLRPIAIDLTNRTRHEESAQWAPAVPVLEDIFGRIDDIWKLNQSHTLATDISACAQTFLDPDFRLAVAAAEERLREGADPADLARALTYAAAIRTARFHLKNEGDWHAVANLYSYAHALYRAFLIAPGPELLRGIFHGIVEASHLQWLNIPSARVPRPDERLDESPSDPDAMLKSLRDLADFQKVYEAEVTVNQYLADGHDVGALRTTLAHILLREDAELHMFQILEAAYRHYELSDDVEEKRIHLLAATRYITAQKVMKGILWATRNAEMLERGELLSERDDED
jgi:nitrite reductase/ring-hydroxylating ferredoxin subunit